VPSAVWAKAKKNTTELQMYQPNPV